MNAIVALCHFCELHGPKIVFCTRPDYNQLPQNLFDNKLTNFVAPLNNFLASANNSCSVSDKLFDESQKNLALNNDNNANLKQKIPDACEACSSILPGQPHYVSIDEETKLKYISSPYPYQPELYSLLRQACVRSLSSEVCPGREGPIYFGDETNGSNVLSYTFFLDDCEARGLHRWYSIIIMMMDKIFLLNSWPFLVGSLNCLIEELQRRAHNIFLQEQTHSRPRARRLQISMTPDKFRQLRGVNSSARSLISLFSDKQFFQRLHRAFVCLLHAGGHRLRERLLEGPPTEDSVVDLEMQEETEEGFLKVFSTKVTNDEQISEGDSDELDTVKSSVLCESLRQLVRVIGYEQFHCVAYHVIIGNQIIVRGNDRGLIRSIIDCLKTMLPKGCCKIVYYHKTYLDLWQCNFLGLPYGTSIPHHVEHCILIDVILPSCQISPSDRSCEVEGAALPIDLSALVLSDYSFRVHSPFVLPENSPVFLTKLENAIMDERLDDDVISQFLLCLKEEWMNKVKVLFKFTKAGGGRCEDETRKLFKIVGAQAEDRDVLMFWRTGLSNQYKNHMLSQAVSQSMWA